LNNFLLFIIFIRENRTKNLMKRIIRLTESELHNLVQRTVQRVLREQDESLLLQTIAQAIVQKRSIGATIGECDADIDLQGGKYAHITYEVESDPYMEQGMRSSSRDVPDDSDEIIDSPTVEIGSIEVCDNEGHCIPIRDNGIVKQALENTIEIDYNFIDDIPSEQEYFNEY
jgi:hypothetical protein